MTTWVIYEGPMSKATVSEILARWPSRRDVASDAQVKPIAVYRWEKRGRIPGHHFGRLLDGARHRGIDLTAEELVAAEADNGTAA